jgi:hypothetical protein
MAELSIFHHAQGLTPGVAHAGEIGFDTVIERGRAAAEGLPEEFGGWPYGVPLQIHAEARVLDLLARLG